MHVWLHRSRNEFKVGGMTYVLKLTSFLFFMFDGGVLFISLSDSVLVNVNVLKKFVLFVIQFLIYISSRGSRKS